MAQPGTRQLVLLGLTTVTTSGTGSDLNLPQGFTSAIVSVTVNTVSGTTPTLNFYVQNRCAQVAATDGTGQLPTGTAIYDDLISFAQVTTTNTQICRIVGGSNVVAAQKNKTLAAGSAASGPIGGTWNVAWVISGTTPSFAFSAVAELIP